MSERVFMEKALIITGGSIDNDFGKEFINTKSYDFIVAVDGGLKFADATGIIPDAIIGDFDTISEDILSKYEHDSNIEIKRLNPVKDSTDTEEAFDLVIGKGIREIDVLGGVGSRLDHSIGNLFLLKKAKEMGATANIFTSNSKIFIINKPMIIRNDGCYKYISFLQFDGAAKGVTLKNFKYCVEDFDFDTDKTYRLGISNEFAGDYGEVIIKGGYLLAILSND